MSVLIYKIRVEESLLPDGIAIDSFEKDSADAIGDMARSLYGFDNMDMEMISVSLSSEKE